MICQSRWQTMPSKRLRRDGVLSNGLVYQEQSGSTWRDDDGAVCAGERQRQGGVIDDSASAARRYGAAGADERTAALFPAAKGSHPSAVGRAAGRAESPLAAAGY